MEPCVRSLVVPSVVLGGELGLASTSALGLGAATARAPRDPLRIGVLLDTSGPAAMHGKRQLLGIRHQANLINADVEADGNPRVRLLVRDTQGNVEITLAHTKALLDTDRVDALIDTSTPATALAMVKAAQQAAVPTVVPTTIASPRQPYIFCSATTSQQTTRQTMRSLAQASLRRAALLILDTLATPEHLKIFFEEASASGVELIAVEQLPISATTLTTPLSILTATAAQAIVVAAPPPLSAVAAREVGAPSSPSRLYCGASAGYPSFLRPGGPAAGGVRVITPWLLFAERVPDTQPNSWAFCGFAASFTPRRGMIGTFAGYGADAVNMLYDACFRHHDRHHARDTLKHLTKLGATGIFHMMPANHASLDDNAITTELVRHGSGTAEGDPL